MASRRVYMYPQPTSNNEPQQGRSEEVCLSSTTMIKLPNLNSRHQVRDIAINSDGNLIVLYYDYGLDDCQLANVNVDTKEVSDFNYSFAAHLQRLARVNDRSFITWFGNELTTTCLNGNTVVQFPTPTERRCFDIDMLDDYMVVSFDDGTIQIKQLKGQSSEPIVTGTFNNRTPTFGDSGLYSRYVSLVREQGVPVAYISDGLSLNANQVTKVSMDGKILMVYNDWRYRAAGPIAATGDGRVFAAFSQSSPNETYVQLITPSMENAVVLGNMHGVANPRAMCYDPNKTTLYVVNNDDDKIMAYKFI